MSSVVRKEEEWMTEEQYVAYWRTNGGLSEEEATAKWNWYVSKAPLKYDSEGNLQMKVAKSIKRVRR